MHSNRQSQIEPRLRSRHRMMTAIRSFFDSLGYLEVETPVRIPAPAPEAHIEPVPSSGWYLQTSPELCMKRLLAAGHSRIYQICRCFRQGERGGRHLPEMTLLEWYTAHADYRDMMAQTEALILAVADVLLDGGRTLVYQGRSVDLNPPWERVSVAEAFARHTGVSMRRAVVRGDFDLHMGLDIEPRLGLPRPVFLMDYPAAHGALARRKADQPELVERFELYIAGLELCNAFSELIDAGEQRRRFDAERDARQAAGKTLAPMPEPFLKDLPDLPPSTGNALGLDRLAMLFTDAADIDAVSAFVPEEL
ncbi:MAG: EF-P lysine aminoacylase EpmA [Pseudomonadota bacterium]